MISLKKKVNRFLVVFLLVLAFIANNSLSIVSANSASLAVPSSIQETDVWCWAGSSVSILRYVQPGIYTQSHFVSTVKGSVVVTTATEPEVLRGLQHYGLVGTQINSSLTLTGIQSNINLNRPVYAGISYFSDGKRNGGHAVVIRGYDTTQSRVSYMDPEDGKFYSMTYTGFKGSSSGTRLWDGTIHSIRRG